MISKGYISMPLFMSFSYYKTVTHFFHSSATRCLPRLSTFAFGSSCTLHTSHSQSRKLYLPVSAVHAACYTHNVVE